MVFTQLLLDQSTPELRKFPFGVLAAQPEEVAQDLVPKILAKTDQGGAVEFLTTDKASMTVCLSFCRPVCLLVFSFVCLDT